MEKMTSEDAKRLGEIFGDSTTVRSSNFSQEKRREYSTYLAQAQKSGWVHKAQSNWVLMADITNVVLLEQIKEKYHDHDGTLRRMIALETSGYMEGNPVLLIGDAGTGKTQLVQTFADSIGKKMYTVNGSAGTRERDIFGMLRGTPDNTFVHIPGPLIRAMVEGEIFYLDEGNAIEPGVLVKMDEPLDKRRQVSIPISEDKYVTYKAAPGFRFIMTINPLSTAGTRTMPNQLMSRFSYKFWMQYPEDADDEIQIVMCNTHSDQYISELRKFIHAAQAMRTASGELPYRPTIRESIAFHNLLLAGFDIKEATWICLLNVGYHWDKNVVEQMKMLVQSQYPV